MLQSSAKRPLGSPFSLYKCTAKRRWNLSLALSVQNKSLYQNCSSVSEISALLCLSWVKWAQLTLMQSGASQTLWEGAESLSHGCLTSPRFHASPHYVCSCQMILLQTFIRCLLSKSIVGELNWTSLHLLMTLVLHEPDFSSVTPLLAFVPSAGRGTEGFQGEGAPHLIQSLAWRLGANHAMYHQRLVCRLLICDGGGHYSR